MLSSVKLLTLLWAINFAPPLLTHIFDNRWNTPLDRGVDFWDGRPLLGPHKTYRGVCGAVAAGTLFAIVLGIPWWIGFASGVLSMAGDILSSFIKRRWNLPSGGVVPGLDQILEGTFPLLVLAPHFSLKVWQINLLIILFSVGAFSGSWFFKKVLCIKPFATYPRQVHPRVRLRELRACELASNPLSYFLNFERAIYYHYIMKTAFRALNIYEIGMQNALEIERRRLTLHFPDLPEAFDGYTILLMADLHLDALVGLTEKLQALVKGVRVDLCILGGDYRMETFGPFSEALHHLLRVVPLINAKDGIIGILGNHDCTEMIEPLHKWGVRFLVNDAEPIQRGEDTIWVAGVDDPHYYKCHDLEAAFRDVPYGAFSILAAHSPEIYMDAPKFGTRLYLCGHTHAGQIQIPNLGPIFTHCKAPRDVCQGSWNFQGMQGYTTSGVGVSGVPVRFFCNGEIVLLTLKRYT